MPDPGGIAGRDELALAGGYPFERLVDELAEVAIAESMPRLEGNQMHTILSRKPQGGGKRPAVAR